MAYRKNFKVNTSGILSPISGATTSRTGSSQVVNAAGYRNYSSNLTDVYVGHPNRIERYNQYETMDLDSEINAALDIIAEFSTQEDNSTETAFELKFHEKATQTEIEILKKQLKNWYNLQEFDKRITKLFRNTIKYGDQIFIRDSETFELYWVDMANVTRIIVNEGQGKEIEQYFIRDLAPNFQNLTATETKGNQQYAQMPQVGGSGGSGGRYNLPSQPYTSASRFNTEQGETAVESEHIVHFSLTEGLDPNWPFGVSVLETIFKVYKQKELLEEAILIYRIQRAPERRVFYIDTGDAPPHLAMQFVERIKNEIHQRRIPTQQGNGLNVMDTTYSPLSINEDFFFPQTADGRGSKVDVLQGGQNLGEIDDLKFFNNKLLRGLRVPSSYLPTGPEDGTQSYTDGRATTAMIQEKRFNEYCKHLQKLVCSTLDREFKMFLSWRGFNIDSSMFELKLAEPLNFAAYREIELDGSRVGNFGAVEGSNLLSRRFILKKYLGLTDVEIAENEKMRLEEMGDSDEGDPEGSDLRNVGISGGDISGDLDTFDDAEFGEFGDEDMGGFDDEMGAGAAPGGTAAGGPGGETMTPGTGPTT